jgi:FixJ family two-component response regulator
MPDMTGLDLAARLRAEGNPMPIMLVTGAPSRAVYERAAQLGIDDLLGKPYDETDLLTFIATAMHRP